jgi:RimJ/RimL family protein N-acetyltransferase
MLRRAERYVRRKWGYNRLGLYVEKENMAAVALYQSLGYQPVTTCDGGDQLGELWYMVRQLTPPLTIREQEVTKSNNKILQTPKTEFTMQTI